MKKNQLVTLGKHIDILSGCAFPSSGFNRNNGVPLIRIRDILSGKTETYYEGSYDLKYLIKKGDLLVGMDGDFNREYWKGTDALLNQRVCKITPNPETLDKNFLYHFLQKELDKIHATTDVVTVKHLSVKKIQDIKIRLPSLKEQKRIAAILDKADAIRQKREQAIKLADDFWRAKFLEMFGTPANNIHRFPKGTIRDLVDSVNYGTSAKASIDSGEYPILRMGNITYQGRWDFTDLKYLDLSVKEKDKYLVKEGDLLFNRTNSKELVGKTAVYEEDRPMAFAGYLIRVRPNSIGNNY
ncbi:TPA: restriction endonuclease, partial [Escherichia coli]|nr:restriction endonuclease [Escherichia coli]